MCGRYNITDSREVHRLLDILNIDLGPLPVRYNVAPTEPTLTIYATDEGYAAMDMRWWLCPSWSDGPSQKFAMFNARSESIEKSRAYRGPFKRHRAIIPATSFIEWQKPSKQPYEIKPVEGPLLFAAVWDKWSDESLEVYSCSMVTTEAVESFKHIHSRQPVMLSLDDARSWLDQEQDIDTLKMLMQPHLRAPLFSTPVDRAIGNSKIKHAPSPIDESEIID